MTTIQFAVQPCSGEQVIAYEVDSTNAPMPYSDGTVEEDGGTVHWTQVAGGTHVYEVRFFKKGTGQNPDWPFKDPQNPGGPDKRFLTIGPGMNVPTKLKDQGPTTQRWKYEVTVPGTTIKALDPMIIIRGKSSQVTLALVAGVSFVAGAAIGLLWNAMNAMN